MNALAQNPQMYFFWGASFVVELFSSCILENSDDEGCEILPSATIESRSGNVLLMITGKWLKSAFVKIQMAKSRRVL